MDAEGYFKKAEEALDGIEISEYRSFRHLSDLERLSARDQYWSELREEIRGEAKRLYARLVSLMGQVARTVRNAPPRPKSFQIGQSRTIWAMAHHRTDRLVVLQQHMAGNAEKYLRLS